MRSPVRLLYVWVALFIIGYYVKFDKDATTKCSSSKTKAKIKEMLKFKSPNSDP